MRSVTDANFIALYATVLTLAPVFEVLPNALAGEGSRFTLYLLLPGMPGDILRARVLHFLFPLLGVGTASVLLLSWEYQPGTGAMFIALLMVLVMITTAVCVAVFASAWDLDIRVQVEGMEQHLLQEEGPFSPRRMLIFQLDLGLVLLQTCMLWRLPAPMALAGLVALALIVIPLLWRFSLAQIAALQAS